MKLLEQKLRRARDALEDARGCAMWSNAPLVIKDALDDSLLRVNEAAQVVELTNSTFYKENFLMKELFKMLETFKSVKSSAIATTERLSKVGGACDKLNSDLDGFFEAAGVAEAAFVGEGVETEGAEGEAAPNGELADPTDATEQTEPPAEEAAPQPTTEAVV